jgi:hypothetical protein
VTASRAREREEGVALRVDLDAAVLGEPLAHQSPVCGQDLVEALAELLQERSRPLDITEDEGHGAAGKRRHRPSIASAWQARGYEPSRR